MTEQDGEATQSLALMPSGTPGHQLPQTSANISAVGIPGYATGIATKKDQPPLLANSRTHQVVHQTTPHSHSFPVKLQLCPNHSGIHPGNSVELSVVTLVGYDVLLLIPQMNGFALDLLTELLRLYYSVITLCFNNKGISF